MALAAPYQINRSERVGEDFAALTAGAHNLTEQSGKPATCVRRILCIAATTFSVLQNHAGVSGHSAAELPAGTVIDADVRNITFTGGPVMVFW